MTAPTSFTQQYLSWGAQSWGLDPTNSRQGCSKYLTYAGRAAYVSVVPLVGVCGALYHSAQALRYIAVSIFTKDPAKSNEAHGKMIHHQFARYYDLTSALKVARDELAVVTTVGLGAITVFLTAATVASLFIELAPFVNCAVMTLIYGGGTLISYNIDKRIFSDSLTLKFIKDPSQISGQFKDGSEEIRAWENRRALVEGLQNVHGALAQGLQNIAKH